MLRWLVFMGAWAALSSLQPRAAIAQDGVLDTDPVLNGWIDRADALVQRQRIAPALRLYRRAADRTPADPRAPLRIADLVLPDPADPAVVTPSDDLRANATEVARRIDAVARTDDVRLARELRRAHAWATAIAGDHRDAIEAVAVAAGRLDGPSASALARLSALAIRRHDLEAAERAIDAARRIDPMDVELLSDHVAVALARGRTTAAIALAREALRRRPEEPEVLRDLAGALLAAGQPREAASVFEGIARERPDDPRAQLDLARAALEAGDAAIAERAAAQALARSAADDVEPALVLAAARVSLGRRDAAREAFREALRRRPGDPRAREGLAALDSTVPPAGRAP